jgi:hypothetical protein
LRLNRGNFCLRYVAARTVLKFEGAEKRLTLVIFTRGFELVEYGAIP